MACEGLGDLQGSVGFKFVEAGRTSDGLDAGSVLYLPNLKELCERKVEKSSFQADY